MMRVNDNLRDYQMTTLPENISAYESMQNELETDHFGKWVVIYIKEVAGFYSSFEDAAKEASRKCGSEPFLISEIGRAPLVLPASGLYQSIANNARS